MPVIFARALLTLPRGAASYLFLAPHCTTEGCQLRLHSHEVPREELAPLVWGTCLRLSPAPCSDHSVDSIQLALKAGTTCQTGHGEGVPAPRAQRMAEAAYTEAWVEDMHMISDKFDRIAEEAPRTAARGADDLQLLCMPIFYGVVRRPVPRADVRGGFNECAAAATAGRCIASLEATCSTSGNAA